MIDKVSDGDINNLLLLKIVDLKEFNAFINPLAFALYFYISNAPTTPFPTVSQQRAQLPQIIAPKVTFLNLDGFDYPFNLEMFKVR